VNTGDKGARHLLRFDELGRKGVPQLDQFSKEGGGEGREVKAEERDPRPEEVDACRGGGDGRGGRRGDGEGGDGSGSRSGRKGRGGMRMVDTEVMEEVEEEKEEGQFKEGLATKEKGAHLFLGFIAESAKDGCRPFKAVFVVCN